jgi:S1-C subfamily serine protease
MYGSRNRAVRAARPRPAARPAPHPGPRAAAGPALLLLALALLATGCSGGVRKPAAGPSSGDTTPAALSVGDNLQQDYERVVKDVLPSVVQITNGQNLGSGVVYDTEGDIVTNAHVVGDARSFQVTLATGTDPVDASLVGSFPADDLAVIRLTRPPGGLHAASFGDSAKVQVGQITLAMGNPLGLSSSVTEGIVSAVGRTVREGSDQEGSPGATIADMVQTSASINPGNSGGALVDLAGRVIGIPTLAATDPSFGNNPAPGIGFAIPASTVTRIAGQLIEHGRVTDSGKAALGITARTVLGADFQPAGAAVVSVTSGGAADQAGIEAGDIITRVADDRITTVGSLSQALADLRPGQRVPVGYRRDGSDTTVTVTLGQL